MTELAERLGIAPATASEHLRVLQKTGLVNPTATGNWRRYRASSTRLHAVVGALIHDLRTPNSQEEP